MDKATRSAGEIQLPGAGEVVVQATSAVAIAIDLALAGAPAAQSAGFEQNMPGAGTPSLAVSSSGGGTTQTITPLNPSGFVGCWIDIFADTFDIGIIAAATNAGVTGGNVPALATTGNAGTAGCCKRILAGSSQAFYVTPDRRFLGVVASGAGFVRISRSGRPG